MPLPSGQQHEFGWRNTRALQVPLLTADPEGDVHEGFFRVPAKYANAPEHSEQRRNFERVRHDKLRKWVEYKMKHGWFLNGPIVDISHAPAPTETVGAESEDGDDEHWVVQALFKRGVPLFMNLDEFLHRRDEAARYGIDLDAPAAVSNEHPVVRNAIYTDQALQDPMVEAQARRQRLGLKRVLNIEDGTVVSAEVVEA